METTHKGATIIRESIHGMPEGIYTVRYWRDGWQTREMGRNISRAGVLKIARRIDPRTEGMRAVCESHPARPAVHAGRCGAVL